MKQATPYQLYRAKKIYSACTSGVHEDRSEHVMVDGVTGYVNFHPGRLALHAPEISSLLDELPPVFQDVQKGLISFVAACKQSEGPTWSPADRCLEQLFQLGVGTRKLDSSTPRDFWGAPLSICVYSKVDLSLDTLVSLAS